MGHKSLKTSGLLLLTTTLVLSACSTGGPRVIDKALLYSAERSTVAEVNHNLAEGADINARDKDGYTPLHVAVGSGHTDVVSY
jgi:ankyrin repeat protein